MVCIIHWFQDFPIFEHLTGQFRYSDCFALYKIACLRILFFAQESLDQSLSDTVPNNTIVISRPRDILEVFQISCKISVKSYFTQTLNGNYVTAKNEKQ